MEITDLKVLLVDDHMIMRNILRQYLGIAGVKNVTEAVHGSEALYKIDQARQENLPFNVVMADWSMPTMDGLTLLKEIRETRGLNDVAFIMITAESEKARIMEALQAGVTSYLSKPFSQEDLQSHVNKILEWLSARA